MELWNGHIPYYDSEVKFMPYLTPYIVEGSKTAVVICPGGGYEIRAEHEGKEYAWFTSTKFHALCNGIG